MGLHRPFDRSLFVIGGAVKTSGGSLDLVKGQLALVDASQTSSAGAKVVSSLAGIAKDKKFLELRLGIDERTPNRSYSNKPMATMPFSLKEVVDIKVSAPERTEQRLDEVILGYNGIDDATSFNLELGETYKRITVEVYGDAISYLGGGYDKEIVSVNFEIPRCDVFNECDDCDPCGAVDCKAWTLNVIETLKEQQLTGGTRLGDVIDITPVLKCDVDATETLIPYDFYCLEVCDTGDADALALVQVQYGVPVKRIDRSGAISKYEMIIPTTAGAPTDYTATGGALIKGCADCVAPSVEVVGGFAYTILVEDEGADITAVIDALVGADTGAVVVSSSKAAGQAMGVGAYTVIFDLKLSDADITGFIGVTELITATFEDLGEVDSLCQFPDEAAVAWVACGQCNVVEKCYLIDLPDTECGTDRLVELQTAYPDLTIELEGTAAGCSTRYKATVVSNLVCDECDPIYLDTFVTEAPETYDTVEWAEDPTNGDTEANTNCKCGIRLKSKPFVLKSGECFRDRINFREDSVRIRVSGGYPEEVREGIGKTPQELFSVTRVSKFEPRTHLGGNLQDFENGDRLYFRDEFPGDNLKRFLRGMESSVQDQCKQYVDYAITVSHFNHSQGFGAGLSEDITYHIFVEVGRHQAVEALLNSIASAAGVGTVLALGA